MHCSMIPTHHPLRRKAAAYVIHLVTRIHKKTPQTNLFAREGAILRCIKELFIARAVRATVGGQDRRPAVQADIE